MKKMSVFVLLGLLVLGMAATASAADIKATGNWKVEAYNLSGTDFYKKGAMSEEKTFNIEQRVRTAFQFIANENLKGVLDLQIGPANWGSGLFAAGAGRSALGVNSGTGFAGPGNSGNSGAGNIMLRKGYLDFKWPGTKTNILAGFQTVSLPAAFGGGSAIFDDQAAAAVVVTPVTDNVKLLAGYGRLFDGNAAALNTASTLSSTAGDVVFAAVPVDFQGFNITPFAAYAYLGQDVGGANIGATRLRGFEGVNSSLSEGVRAYWGGFATTITAIDNFKIMADFNYGKATWNNQTNNQAKGGRSGWLADIAVDYTGLKMMTPSAFFVYSSGEKGNSTDGGGSGSGRMPVVGSPQNWAVGSFFFGDREFATNPIAGGGSTANVMGFWVAGLSLKNMSFIDKLSHTAHLMYIKGTNDKKFLNEGGGGTAANNARYGAVLTTKDSLWEVDFNTKYMIYDELSVLLNLGYIANNINKGVWADESTLGASTRTDIREYGGKDAYRIAVGVNYNF